MSLRAKYIFTTVLFILFFLLQSYFSKPHFTQFSPKVFEAAHINITKAKPSSASQTFYNKLIKKADQLLLTKNPSVMDKTIMPPTNSKHNYLSISRYYWPNPKTKTKDSLPWIYKEGKVNPYTLTKDLDRNNIEFLGNALTYLSLAYKFTKEEKYAEKGISMLNTWFLNPQTAMNPNLKHAQIIPGDKNPQRTGIIDGCTLTSNVLDAYIIFKESRYWNPKTTIYMDLWFEEYLKWLVGSEIGKYAAIQTNNHSSWYKYQVAALSLHLGKRELVEKIIEETQKLISKQFSIQGTQVYETVRSKPLAYSCYNLEALTRLAIIGEKIGVDLWNYKTKERKSIQKGISFLINAPNFKELYDKSSEKTLSSLFFVLHYYQKKIALSSKEKGIIKELIENYKLKIKSTPFSELFKHYYLIEGQ